MIVHTGQHYDKNMSDVFFADLRIPAPDVHLGVGSGSHGVQTGAMLAAMDAVLDEHGPDWVLVYGDTNSTLAGTLSAVKMHLPVAHLEAGLRSFNRLMPEEHNRVLTDHAADLLLAPTQVAMDHLANEGLKDRSRLVGDVMTDVCFRVRDAVKDDELDLPFKRGEYIVSTIHRAENTDDPERLAAIVDGLGAAGTPVLLLAHPRLRREVCGARHQAGASGRFAARPRAAGVPGDGRGRARFGRCRDRLRRSSEGGLPARPAVHHAAHRDRVGRDAGRRMERVDIRRE